MIRSGFLLLVVSALAALVFFSGESLHRVFAKEPQPAKTALIPPPSALPASTVPRKKIQQYNVLFIVVDDLRPAMRAYGDRIAITPNIDKLAAHSTTFGRAYCQQALCAPSRTSVLTGLRPDTTHCYDQTTSFRTNLPNVVTLPQQFKIAGYHTEAMGKVFHTSLDDKPSWSIPTWLNNVETGDTEEPLAAADPLLRQHMKAWASPNVPDNQLIDGKIADHAVERLGVLSGAAANAQPFFLAVGFHKPHLPLVAPDRYWDLYKATQFKPADNPEMPAGAPKFAGTPWGELRAYEGIPREGPLSAQQAQMVTHGYYACVSYADAQVGRVLRELDRLGLRDNTIVVLWGDHGWHLGEHGLWCKQTNYEHATAAPLIVSAPGHPGGTTTDGLVEFVDIYPSLCELCRVGAPNNLDGISFVPLMEQPQKPWKRAAFSQFPRHIPQQGDGMGRTLVTDRYRFVEWTVPASKFERLELYDHLNDPEENVNIADHADQAEVVAELHGLLHEGWRAALPGEKRN